MDEFSNSMTCCLCNFLANTEQELEAHIDVSHADIFKQNPSNEDQEVKVINGEYLHADPIENSLQTLTFLNPGVTHSSKRRNRRKKESVDSDVRLAAELPDEVGEAVGTTKQLRKARGKSVSWPEMESRKIFPKNEKVLDNEGGRGQKRPSTKSEAEPRSKRISETSTNEEKPVLQAASFIEALDSLRQEVNATKMENAKLREDLHDYNRVRKELNDLKFSQNRQQKNEQSSLKRQIGDLKVRNADLERKLIEISGKHEALGYENNTLKSRISNLEQDFEIQKKLHAKDQDELAKAKDTASTLYNGILKKTNELTQTVVALERSDLEVKKLTKNIKNLRQGELYIYRKGFDSFNTIKKVFESVLIKDSSFCQTYDPDDSFENLDDDEIVAMVCSVVEDSVESKRLHFADIESTLNQLADLDKRKKGYKGIFKEMTVKLKSQNDVLKVKNDEIRKLSVSLQSKDDDIRRLSAREEYLEGQVQNKTKQIDEMRKAIAEQRKAAQTQITSLNKKVETELSKEVTYLITIAELRSECSNKNKEVDDLKLRLDFFETDQKDMKEMISRLNRKLLFKNELIANAKLRSAEHEEKENLLKQEADILKEELKMKGSLMTSLEKSKHKLEYELRRVKSNLEKMEENFVVKEKEFAESLMQHTNTVTDIEIKVKALAEDREAKLESLVTELEASDDIMITMRKAVDQKSVRIKNLETEMLELNKKIETTRQENLKMKKDLAWAKTYCTEMNQKVKELSQTAPVPLSTDISLGQRQQRGPNLSQERMRHGSSNYNLRAKPISGINWTQVKHEEQSSTFSTENVVSQADNPQTFSTSLSNHLAQVGAKALQSDMSGGGLRLVPLSQLQAPAKPSRFSII